MIGTKYHRFQRSAALIVALLLLVGFGFVSAQTQQQTNDAHNDAYLVMISVDGLMPEYYTKADRYGLKIPNIRELCRTGSYAEASESIYPSMTYPSHVTLATGVRPAKHGVVSNLLRQDPITDKSEVWYWLAKDIKAPTIWGEARKNKLKTAAVGWPATVGAEIDYNIPEVWEADKFETCFKTSLENSSGIPENILSALPESKGGEFSDEARVKAAEAIISNYRPNLLLLHLTRLDYIEHESGPFTNEAFAELEKSDEYIGRIASAIKAAGISDQTTIFVVSDHGFMKVEKEYEPGVALAKAGLIDVSKDGKIKDWKAMIYGYGGSVAIMLKDPKDAETEKQAIDLFEAVARKSNSPIYRVVKRDELVKLGANTEAICFLDASRGYSFGTELTGGLIKTPKDYKGGHGVLPSRPEMYASFIASGRGILKGGRETYTKNIHIAPTAAALLGFQIPDAEGKPMREILTIAVPKLKDKK